MIDCIQNINEEIRCRQRYLAFQNANARELITEAISRIREREHLAKLSTRQPKSRSTLVGYSYDLINRAIEIDSKNARRYARVLVRDYLSSANVERRMLSKEGITEEAFKREYEAWRKNKAHLEEIGFGSFMAVGPEPRNPFYYAKQDEIRAQEIKLRYDLK